MKPTYNSNQQGFDFGNSNLLQDICTILDLSNFPYVEPEDIANKLRCRGDYALDVYRKCMEIWEFTLDTEIVEFLRALPDRDGMSVEMIAIVLGETYDSVKSDIDNAMDRLGFVVDQLVKDSSE